MKTGRNYPGKVLLFGEYTVIHGGHALAIPLRNYTAKWSQEGDEKSTKVLGQLKRYVEEESKVDALLKIDFDKWELDVLVGLSLKSTIKAGYGVGSSGAVVAACYDRYFKHVGSRDVEALRGTLAMIESFFHGSSSGIDPLVSYMDQGVLKKGSGEIELNSIDLDLPNLKIGLLDTGQKRETSALVKAYLKKYAGDALFPKVVDQIKKINKSCIYALMKKDESGLFHQLKFLSRIQFDNFEDMIPADIYPLWKETLSSEEHIFKLCGAGGGGYFLAFTKNVSALEILLKKPIIWL